MAVEFANMTPWEIAVNWYSVDEIANAVRRSKSETQRESVLGEYVPRDVESREFAEWLTDQYRLAMSKGIDMERRRTQSPLRDAITRGGFDLSPCMECGEAVVCIPDGLPCCEGCAASLSAEIRRRIEDEEIVP